MVSPHEVEELLKLARDAVSAVFAKKELKLSEHVKKKFSKEQGVFVSLHKNKELRGCIGFAEPVYPLYNAVIRAATSAAFKDPRFTQLKESEMKEVKFEISVLTVPELIEVGQPTEYLKRIEIGKDGLIVRYGPYSGLLLPQVAKEWGWNVEQFLENTCTKAGLAPEAWKESKCDIFKFQAMIASEN
ncbi:MAG: AmmeMemoRadiSam system protein A [bacterium]|nr:AmmeMemoRadiSam system protein A [bacterium]